MATYIARTTSKRIYTLYKCLVFKSQHSREEYPRKHTKSTAILMSLLKNSTTYHIEQQINCNSVYNTYNTNVYLCKGHCLQSPLIRMFSRLLTVRRSRPLQSARFEDVAKCVFLSLKCVVKVIKIIWLSYHELVCWLTVVSA